MAKRMTLVQRQQKLLEERGFSKPRGCSSGFQARQDRHLSATGRANAIGSSRCKVDFTVDGDDALLDDNASVASSRVSHAPSLHPSLAGSIMSEACHSDTIGAGDQTMYWDYQHRMVERQDLGHKCKECKLPFTTIGEPLTERRGARISMRYHAACFSGFADPRSQIGSSHHTGKLSGTQLQAAPGSKPGSKMRTSSHFEGGGHRCSGEAAAASTIPPPSHAGGGKSGMGLGMGSHGFGAKSSRGTGAAPDMNLSGFDLAGGESSAGPGLSEAQLKAHACHTASASDGITLALGQLEVVQEEHEHASRPSP
jgi:hypothetical protein